MRKHLLMAAAFTLMVQQTVVAQTDSYGYETVELSMGSNYQNQVFYSLPNNSTHTVDGNAWDIAFYRNNAMDFGIKVNDSRDISVYQVSANPAAFDTVDLSQKTNWGEPLYNPDITERIQDGAFGESTLLAPGNFNYGWGSYDMVTHTINGKVVFVLEYGNGTYYKFFIEKYAAGYTFKYAKWDVTAWGATQTQTVANGADEAYFNYFSFDTNAKVANVEPGKNNWSLWFTRYYTFYNNAMMYRLSGAIQNPNLEVARVRPETQATNDIIKPEASAFSKMITTIGHSWKPTSSVYSDVVYYIKENGQYYRLYFTENGGATTGNMYFKYKNITQQLSTSQAWNQTKVGIFPNPVVNKKATLLVDANSKSGKATVQLYDIAGRKVYETTVQPGSGLSQQELNLSQIAAGMYVAKITIGGTTQTQKLIIK